MRQQRFAVEHLKPGGTGCRDDELHFAARTDGQAVEMDADTRNASVGQQVLACGAIAARFGRNRLFVKNSRHAFAPWVAAREAILLKSRHIYLMALGLRPKIACVQGTI